MIKTVKKNLIKVKDLSVSAVNAVSPTIKAVANTVVEISQVALAASKTGIDFIKASWGFVRAVAVKTTSSSVNNMPAACLKPYMLHGSSCETDVHLFF